MSGVVPQRPVKIRQEDRHYAVVLQELEDQHFVVGHREYACETQSSDP